MNRTEALTQLNQERKRKENRVWEEWFKTENSNQVTSERLVKRTAELNRIRDEYEKAVFQINNQREQEVPPPSTPLTFPQKPQNKQTAQVSQKEGGVVRGAENLPENKPISLGQEIRRRTTEPTPTQEDVREPEIVRAARAQNIQNEIEENQFQNETEYRFERSLQNTEEAQAETIRDTFRAVGINLSEVAESKSNLDLINEIKEAAKNSSVEFPILILFVAFLKDMSDLFSSFLATIPYIGIVVWLFAAFFSVLCSVVIWFWMLGRGTQMHRKIIIKFVVRRLPLIMIGLFGELTPWISIIPTTTIIVFFVAQTSTRLGRAILNAVEKIEELK